MALYLCSCCETQSATFNFVSFIKDIGPILVGIAAIMFSFFQSKRTLAVSDAQNRRTLAANDAQNLRTLDAKKLEEKRSEIYKKLNDFYGPILQLRKKSHLLYQKFEENYRKSNPNFSTLSHLLKGGTFSGNDKILIDEIITIGEKTEALIHEKAGLIDVPELRLNLIPRATTHFLILRLAYQGLLIGEEDRFHDLTFPHELDQKLEDRKKELELELQQLNATS